MMNECEERHHYTNLTALLNGSLALTLRINSSVTNLVVQWSSVQEVVVV